jgi:hypothetical protein
MALTYLIELPGYIFPRSRYSPINFSVYLTFPSLLIDPSEKNLGMKWTMFHHSNSLQSIFGVIANLAIMFLLVCGHLGTY